MNVCISASDIQTSSKPPRVGGKFDCKQIFPFSYNPRVSLQRSHLYRGSVRQFVAIFCAFSVANIQSAESPSLFSKELKVL